MMEDVDSAPHNFSRQKDFYSMKLVFFNKWD